tara:strand:+ start:196 stop:2403 length:2208 start_codon:yes stop_codon:yes gene_type:complete
MNNNWFKKEKPFATLIGMGGGATGLANAGGGGPTIEASGGIISEYSVPTGEVYRAHVFVGDGSFVVSKVVGDGAIQYLLVGGGGAGGSDVDSYGPPGTYMRGGGGGGGGFRTNIPGHPLSASNPITVSTSPYPVDIGQGGRFGAQPMNEATVGFRGSKTIINHPTTPVQADGGGGGGSSNPAIGGIPGATGGGGAAGGASGGSGNTPPYSPVQGYGGGTGAPTVPGGAGGGGGAGGAGGDGPTGRTGGAGVLMAVEDGTTPVYYGGGGGGGTVPTSRSSSGDGNGSGYSTDPIRTQYGQGGGLLIPTSGPVQTRTNSALTYATGRDGMSGFGGGGGGAGQYATGGQGGTGCAIIRYQIPGTSGTAKASGGMISYYNGKVIHTFRATGTFTTTGSFNETVEYFIVGGGGAGGFAGGGGGAGEVKTGTTPINADTSMDVTVGAGGRGFGITESWSGYGERSGAFGWLSSFGAPAGTIEAGGGNFGGGPNVRGGIPGTNPTEAGSVVNRLNGCGGGSSGGSPTPQSNSPTGMPYGGEGDPNSGGGGGGAAEPGDPSDNSPTPCGGGGAGVQCPTTFRNPMSSVGYPGPNGENWWFAAGGAGGSKGTGNPGPNPTNPSVLQYGRRGGGHDAANSPTLPSENASGSYGISQNDNCYWGGAGNSQGYKNCLNVPTSFPVGQHITWKGMGGQAAANSGSGGGGGVGFAYAGFGPTGPAPTKRGVSGGGGPGGPGIVMIAYPE